MGWTLVRKKLVLLVGLSLLAGAAPPAAAPNNPSVPDPQQAAEDAALRQLVDELEKVGALLARAKGPAEIVQHNLRQAELIVQISNRSKPEEREPWLRQLADCLSAAAQSSPANDRTAYQRLLGLEEYIARNMPGSALAAYVAYREIQAAGANQATASEKELHQLQAQWRDRLARFVQTYPQAEEAPGALLELGMACELMGQEAEAKRWFRQLAQQYPNSPLAAKADGAVRRLELEGQMLQLALPKLDDPNEAFDIDQLRGKVVVVYFWASWDKRCAEDFARLKQLVNRFGDDRVGVLGVNLDARPEEATAFLSGRLAPGVQVFQKGGLEGRTAKRYGLLTLPTLILVDRDGKVASRKVEVGKLEYRIEQLLKPVRPAAAPAE